MSDEELKIDLEQDEENQQEEEVNEAPQYSEVELQAIEDGWRPQDEWEGNPDDWVSAKEFNFRGSLMKRVSTQSSQLAEHKKEMEAMTKAMKAMKDMQQKTAEIENKRIMDALKKRKKEALEDGDSDAIMEIDDKIEELKEMQREEKAESASETTEEETTQDIPPAVKDWLEGKKQEWYHKDKVAKRVADGAWDDYTADHPNADPVDVLAYVDKKVREELPHKFNNTKRTAAAKVTETNGNVKPTPKNKFTKKDLSDEQLQVANTFVKQGVYKNIQDYVNDLADIGEIA